MLLLGVKESCDCKQQITRPWQQDKISELTVQTTWQIVNTGPVALFYYLIPLHCKKITEI